MTRSHIARSTPLLLLVLSACGGRAEQHLLRTYFDTCATADEVALANTALVVLDPERDGVVGRFRLLEIGALHRRPASAHPLAARLSLYDPQKPRAEADASLEMKTIAISAELFRGTSVSTVPMTVTMTRARTEDAVGRWVVIRLVLDGRTLPEASSGRR